ncbi:MAG TPA: helix-turn-helix domain-containing protein [Trebonia sp.]|nr:helix-turn-helix domain-containing protein [Trebonia sp.]
MSTARPLRQDAVRNRERLVLAAREIFREKGIDAPLEEIARAAGVAIGTLYNRFPDRGQLIDAALGPLAGRAADLAELASREADPWQAFVSFVTGTCEQFAADRGYADVYRVQTHGTPVIDAARKRLAAVKEALMARATSAGVLRPDIEVADVVLLIWGVAAIMDATRDSAPDAWRRHLALQLDGLRRAAAHPLPGPPLAMSELRNTAPR